MLNRVKGFGRPSLKIETYQPQINNKFWLAEGTQTKILFGQWAQIRKQEKS